MLFKQSDPGVPRGKFRRPLPKFMLRMALGLALFGGLLAWAGLDALRKLAYLRPWPVLAAFACTLVIVASIGMRWRMLANALMGRPVLGWLDSCRYFLWNRALGFVVPKDVSDIAGRTLLLTNRHALSLQQAATSVLLDRGFDVLTMLLCAGPALLFLSDAVTEDTALFLMGVLVLISYALLQLASDHLLAFATSLYNAIRALAHRLPGLHHNTFEQVERPHLPQQTLSRAFLLSVIKLLAISLRFTCFAQALEMSASPLVFIMGTPIAQLSFLFALTPGGLGILEATWYGVLLHSGISRSLIVPFLVEQRVLTMVFVGVLTACGEALGSRISQ